MIAICAALYFSVPTHAFGTFSRCDNIRLPKHSIKASRRFFSDEQAHLKFPYPIINDSQQGMKLNLVSGLNCNSKNSFIRVNKPINDRYGWGKKLIRRGFSASVSLLAKEDYSNARLAKHMTRLFMSTEVETSTTESSTILSIESEKNGTSNISLVTAKSQPLPSLSSPQLIHSAENDTKSILNGQITDVNVLENNDENSDLLRDETNTEILDDKPQPTANGGYSHTASSKAKISQANKGKTPWNKGRKRTEADKARISAGVRARNRERLLKKIAEMGLTEEEYNAKLEKEKKEAAEEKAQRKTARGGYTPTAETKAKISKILLEKHKKGEIKKRSYNHDARKGMKHSDETKKKISESLKARWNGDPEYKANIQSKIKESNGSEDVRARISNTLKDKWKDPEFRAYMMEKMAKRKPPSNQERGDEYRKKISESMKKKWEDPDYRAKALKGMQTSGKKRTSTAARKKKVSTGLKKKKKKKKKAVGAVMLEPTAKIQPTSETETVNRTSASIVGPKKKKKKKKKKPQNNTESTTLPSSLIVENTEEEMRVSKMKDERRDLYDLLYGEEEREEQKSADPDDNFDDNDYESDASYDESSIDNEYSSIFEDDEDDFNIDDFDPYGLDELEQNRF